VFEIRECKVGDKILYNRCPLKYEGRESWRGEILYKFITETKHNYGEPANASTTDMSDT